MQVKKFEFSEEDLVGEETLEAIGRADHFNNWMYQTIKQWCKGNVLEIGSGAGNISQFFIRDSFQITLTDIRDRYCVRLRTKFGESQNLAGIEKVNLIHPEFENTYSHLINCFDTVFALNVVEHIENDSQAIANSKKLLKPGGHLIVLVPSYEFLYNGFDKGLGHYRRYNTKTLSELFLEHDLSILKKQHFNFAGMFGWYFTGSILKKKTIPIGQMKIYNALVPVFKLIDKLVFQSVGLSTIVIGKKNE